MRNAIAHNAIVLDVRFKSGGASSGIGKLLNSETGVKSINFSDITDYIVLIAYLLGLFGFSKTERKALVSGYETILSRYKKELPPGIYGKFVRTETAGKLKLVLRFVSQS